LGRRGIGDVEQDAVARAGAGRDLGLREDGDVVALVGAARFLGLVAVVAAGPEAGELAGGGVGEDCGAVDDAGLRGVSHGISTTSMRNRAVRVSPGISPTQPASSFASRTEEVPET
jgi:hypothetical protein